MLLVVLAVGLVLVATNLIDPNEYKPKISQLVEDKTGRKLDMQGDLALTFFPWIGVETGKVSLSNAAGFADVPMVAVDNALVKVKLLPLLKKQVEVDTVVLDAPNIRLQTLADGRTNWDDLVDGTGDKSGSDKPAAQGAGAIAGLAIQGISISDGLVQWQNDQADQSLLLEQLNLSTGSLVPGDPLDIELSVNASGNIIPEPAEVKLDTTVTLSENMAAVSLAETSLEVAMKSIKADLTIDKVSYALQAGLAAINGLKANLDRDGVKSDLAAASINFNLSDETLELPSLNIIQDDVSIAAAISAAGVLSAPAARGTFDLKAADVAAFLARNGLKVELPDIDLKALSTQGRFNFKDDVVQLDGFNFAAEVNALPTTIEAPSLRYDIKSNSIAAPSLQISQADFSFKGGIEGSELLSDSRSLGGQVDVAVADVAALLARNGLKVELPDIDLKALSTQGRFNFKDDVVQLDGFNFAAEVNALPTTIEAPSLRYDIKSNSIAAPSLQIAQADFSFKGGIEGSELLSDSRSLGGQVDVAVADVAALLSRNGLELELPDIPLQNIKLTTKFDVSGPKIAADALLGRFDHKQQPTEVSIPSVRLDLDSGALDLGSLSVSQGDFSLEANAKGTGVTGDLAKMNVSGKLKMSAADLPALLARNEIPAEIPEGLLTALNTSLGFKIADNNAAISNLDAKIDDMTIKGSAGLNNFASPGYLFDLVINKLDVDSLVASDGSQPAAEKPSTSEQLLLPVAPLRGLNVDGKAKIGTLITTGLTLNDVNVKVKSDENVLSVAPMTANAFGGSIETQLTYDVSRDVPAIRIINKVDNVDVGALLQSLEISEKVSGTGNLTTNLSGRGADADAVIASLNGDIGFRLLNGAIKGYDLQAALIKIEQQVSQLRGGETTTRESPAAETRFAELAGSFKVQDGIFRNDDLDMKAPLFRVSGSGAMNLPQSRIDYKLNVNVVETVEGQGGKSLGELKGARIPLKIYGSLADPTYTLDLAALLKDQAKKELNKQILKKIAPTGTAPVEGGAEPDQIPENPEEAIKQELKKKLQEGLLKGLGLG